MQSIQLCLINPVNISLFKNFILTSNILKYCVVQNVLKLNVSLTVYPRNVSNNTLIIRILVKHIGFLINNVVYTATLVTVLFNLHTFNQRVCIVIKLLLTT